MTEDALRELKDNVSALMQRCQALQQENLILQQGNEMQRKELLRTHEELVNLQRKYKSLQTATSIAGDAEHREQAKRKLTQLIRMVDNALENLSE